MVFQSLSLYKSDSAFLLFNKTAYSPYWMQSADVKSKYNSQAK